ncbi:MAG TPA: pyrroloquinoline quinone biosynthesis peptide chaperone PqqD [Methylomirabilota bacterium]|nr:pyrroloquinoline quinone biosynthesis peptide chaperone PqqD [Methylomirabilota bacterium]
MTAISLDTRPRLAAKARLRWDRKDERFMLLYPERGLVLNPTAADVVKLCTGELTVGTIVEQLASKYTSQTREAVEREVVEFITRLAERGLVTDAGD